ncbi:AraC family transcriptional regulator [Tengunoibacter tsumagoiensis]|uniref:AraC family transcriptional regulator n=2 Tax=Tengunoibacter tsumagoiensis TaxID=2014871 RepID=A0A402A7N8_9CHLR|nr:AraC family transcriptional regulator [Tengunoibacter tsumagoiensis]
MNIVMKDIPTYEVAYVRHVGSYLDTSASWEKLGQWAANNALFPPDQHVIGISLDDPNSVDEYACRYDSCITIPKGFEKEKHTEVQFQHLPGGLYACYQFYDTIEKIGLLYQNLYGQWLPQSEYDADDRPCLEFCLNNPAHDPERKCKAEICIPIRKRR